MPKAKHYLPQMENGGPQCSSLGENIKQIPSYAM